jgi:hypothetical protein
MKISLRLPVTAAGLAFAMGLATTAAAQNFTMKFGTANRQRAAARVHQAPQGRGRRNFRYS